MKMTYKGNNLSKIQDVIVKSERMLFLAIK